jgi:hypothetical protein
MSLTSGSAICIRLYSTPFSVTILSDTFSARIDIFQLANEFDHILQFQ